MPASTTRPLLSLSLSLTLFGDQPNEMDPRLARFGISRRAPFVSRSLAAAPAVVGSSALIATLSQAMAER
jgi:hypothetical protein